MVDLVAVGQGVHAGTLDQVDSEMGICGRKVSRIEPFTS